MGEGLCLLFRVGGADQRTMLKLLLFLLCCVVTPNHCLITFTIIPSDVVIARGSPALFNCSVTSTGFIFLTWQKDGLILSPSLPKYTYFTNNSLQINPTEIGDNGTYYCVVTEQETLFSSNRSSSLAFAFILDVFVAEPESQTVDQGGLVFFFCIHAGSLPPVNIVWRLNGTMISSLTRVSIQSSVLVHTDPSRVSSSLTISSVQRSDVGGISCIATNPLLPNSPVTSREATLLIRAQPIAPAITTHPSDIIVIEGKPALLSCSANGEPPPLITWQLDDSLVVISSQVTIANTSGGTSELRVASVTMENLGTYRCMATNSEGTASSSSAELIIATIENSFVLEPMDTSVVIGQSVIMDCIPPPSVPPAVVLWSRDFSQLNGPRYQVLGNGSLKISEVQLEDGATFHCTATNTVSAVSRTSRGASLTAIGEPLIVPSMITVPVGQFVSFSCSAIGSTPPQITWWRRTNQITRESYPRATVSGSMLMISDVTMEDGGYYTCRATFTTSTHTAQAQLNILALATQQAAPPTSVPPTFTSPILNVTAVLSTSATLPCRTILDSTLTFSWLFDNKLLSPAMTGEGPLVLTANGSLILASVARASEGIYTCVATNSLGVANGTVYLVVYVLPSITADSPSVTSVQGAMATLWCVSTGIPIPVQSWTRNGVVVSGSRIQVSGDGRTLTVSLAREEDEGTYTCHASNYVGTSSDNVTLEVFVPPSALATPTILTLNEGDIANFTCFVMGDPAPGIRWLTQMGEDLGSLTDPRLQLMPIGAARSSLLISDLRRSDEQQYVCQAINVVSMATSTVSLRVLVPAQVNLSRETTTIQGNSFVLDCHPTGHPLPMVTWFREGVTLQTDSRVSVDSTGRIVFSTVFSTDAASYMCIATNSIGGASASTNLRVLVVPVIQITTPIVVVNVGTGAILDCLATGNPMPVVTWFFNSALVLTSESSRVLQAANNSLLVSDVLVSDEGQYLCQARNVAGTESATIQLIVHVGPTIQAVPSAVTALTGTNVILRCIATGTPVPIQTWTRNGIPLTDSRFQVQSGGGELSMREVREEDEGRYQCHALNVAGSAIDMVDLNIISIPVVQVTTASPVVEGAHAVLNCLATGDPLPQVSWFLNSALLPNAESLHITQAPNNSLLFSPVQGSDRGLYICRASNVAGSDSGSVQLTVYIAPSIQAVERSLTIIAGNSVTMTCIATGNPVPVLTWTRHGEQLTESRFQVSANGSSLIVSDVRDEDEGIYVCSAANLASTHTDIVTLAVIVPPSAPSLLSVTTTSSRAILLQWTSSINNGGSLITSYTVEYRDSSDMASHFGTRSFGGNVLSALLDGLRPFVTYEVRVRADNIAGFSSPSNALSSQTHPEAPSSPVGFTVVSFTTSSLSLRWGRPNPLNGVFAAYELRYAGDDSFDTNVMERLLFSSTFTITGVEMGVVFRAAVRASTVSLTGETLWGPFSVLRVVDGVELEVPTSQTSAPPTTTPTTMATTLTTSTDSITELLLTEPSSTGSPTTATPGTEVPSTPPMTSPNPATESPSTAVPTSGPPDTEPPTSPLNPPTVVPIAVTALIPPLSVGQILLYWREPVSANFIGYQVMVSPPPPSVATPILVPRTSISSTFILRDLASFTSYTVTVATYNNDGVGPLTESVTITTPETAPSAPRSLQAVAVGSRSLLLSWFPPKPPNGILMQYLLLVVVNTTGQLVDNRTLLVTLEEQKEIQVVTIGNLDLDNVLYLIQVSASTGAGQGPNSEPVFIGNEIGSNVTFTPVIATSSSPASTTYTTSTSVTYHTTQLFITDLSPPRGSVYYTIRVTPPVVGALVLVAVVIGVIWFCIYSKRRSVEKKGSYQFCGLENECPLHLRDIHEVNKQMITGRREETNSMKEMFSNEMFDSNFSLSPPSQESSVQDSTGPDLGQVLEQSYIDMELVRARKEEQAHTQEPSQTTPTNTGAKDPSFEMSSGGIMETRIGSVGVAMNGRLPLLSETNAHMY